VRWLRAAVALIGVLLLAGCGVPVDIHPGDVDGAFPHPEDYALIHMEYALEDDSSCFQCHAEDQDSWPEDATNLHCSYCHAYPPVHLEDEE
jgi:hypothetical protein